MCSWFEGQVLPPAEGLSSLLLDPGSNRKDLSEKKQMAEASRGIQCAAGRECLGLG